MKFKLIIIGVLIILLTMVFYFYPSQISSPKSKFEISITEMDHKIVGVSNANLQHIRSNNNFFESDTKTITETLLKPSANPIATIDNEEMTAAEAVEAKANALADSEFQTLFENKINNVFTFPVEIILSEKQYKSLNEVVKNYTPRLEKMILDMEAVLTEEQVRDRKAALMRSGLESDSDQKREDAILKALNLTHEQESTLIALEEKYTSLQIKIRKEMTLHLTPQQKKNVGTFWHL